jgi:hypothetical protein
VPRIEKSTLKDLEKKFGDTAFRLTQERNDFFLPQVCRYVLEDRWINLRPEYQRRLVWDQAKRSLFIESLLLNVPIPPVFLYECDLSRYEVMDGQQRLSCVVDFLQNEFALKGLSKWEELNGLRYRDLPEMLRRGLERRRISATVLLVGSSEQTLPEQSEVRRLVFERLNTGGQQLNAQELRNCFYAGDFNDLLIRLSRNKLFTDIWEIPPYDDNVDKHGNISSRLRNNQRYKRMQDCEIVLRFFAFRKRSKIRGAVRTMLDRCMEDHLSIAQGDLLCQETDFNSRLKFAFDLFGKAVFRYKDKKGHWQLSIPLYDGLMIALDRLWEQRDQLILAKKKVVSAVGRVLEDDAKFEVIVGKPNTAKAVLNRMELLEGALRSAIQ